MVSATRAAARKQLAKPWNTLKWYEKATGHSGESSGGEYADACKLEAEMTLTATCRSSPQPRRKGRRRSWADMPFSFFRIEGDG